MTRSYHGHGSMRCDSLLGHSQSTKKPRKEAISLHHRDIRTIWTMASVGQPGIDEDCASSIAIFVTIGLRWMSIVITCLDGNYDSLNSEEPDWLLSFVPRLVLSKRWHMNLSNRLILRRNRWNRLSTILYISLKLAPYHISAAKQNPNLHSHHSRHWLHWIDTF